MLEDFFRDFSHLDKARFIASFPHPFLLVDYSGPALKPGDPVASRPTTVIDVKKRQEQVRREAANRWIMPLLKSARNPDPERITMGRNAANDIVIPHASVSGSHAYFRKHPAADRYSIVDAGSTFGTTANGEDVDKAAGRPLSSGDRIVLAKAVTVQFLLPKELFDLLHMMKLADQARPLGKGPGA
jgi:hypothetical protein